LLRFGGFYQRKLKYSLATSWEMQAVVVAEVIKGSLKVELPCNGFLKITTTTITISPLSQYHRYHNITTITISLLSQFHQYPNITTIATTIITITIITHITTITISPPSQSPL